jgi:hypothetical protein
MMMSLHDVMQKVDNETVILVDGEFDGISTQRIWKMWDGKYAIRTAKDTNFYKGQEEFKLGEIPLNNLLETY